MDWYFIDKYIAAEKLNWVLQFKNKKAELSITIENYAYKHFNVILVPNIY